MTLLPAEILRYAEPDFGDVEYIECRRFRADIRLVEADPSWSYQYEELATAISGVLGGQLVSIAHVGSTSVPGLLAKPIIDIDVIVKDIFNEQSYVDGLKSIGFTFRLRRPSWYNLRFFILDSPPATSVNLKVFGRHCPEVERHIIFRNWLRGNSNDKERYARAKLQALRQSNEMGEALAGYNRRKEQVLREIMDNAFRALGYLVPI